MGRSSLRGASAPRTASFIVTAPTIPAAKPAISPNSAGNWGKRYDYFICLDADSLMTGDTLVYLARLMDMNPKAGLIQTSPQPIGGKTLFARIQQFASALYNPLFALGTAFWYPGRSNYWGHNAIIRTEAFMTDAGLPILPGKPPLGGEILSHDFVEAALLARSGWSVWLVPEVGGSYEELPPTLADYAQRDQRWCQGNLQHSRLLPMKGLLAVSRMHLLFGVMSYMASVFWLALLMFATLESAWLNTANWAYFPDAGSLFPTWPVSKTFEMLGLYSITMGMLFVPKLMAMSLGAGGRATTKSLRWQLRADQEHAHRADVFRLAGADHDVPADPGRLEHLAWPQGHLEGPAPRRRRRGLERCARQLRHHLDHGCRLGAGCLSAGA